MSISLTLTHLRETITLCVEWRHRSVVVDAYKIYLNISQIVLNIQILMKFYHYVYIHGFLQQENHSRRVILIQFTIFFLWSLLFKQFLSRGSIKGFQQPGGIIQ